MPYTNITGARFRMIVIEHIHGQNHKTPAGQFDKVKILHFPVIKHAVADYNTRDRFFGADTFGHKEQAAHLGAGSCHPPDIADSNLTAAALDE